MRISVIAPVYNESVSLGEEKPRAEGHDEQAWSQNRRDEFEIIGGGDNLRKP